MVRRCVRRRSGPTRRTTAGRRPFRRTPTARTAPGRKHCRTAALRCKSVLVGLREVATEAKARAVLVELNARIARTNAATVAEPPTSLAPLDLEEALRRYWRKARETF